MPEIQLADPALRRRALAVLVAMAAAGALFLAGTSSAQGARSLEDVVSALWLLSIAIVVPTVAYSVHAWRLGARIRSESRFPPAGVGVVRDTVVLEGRAAQRRGLAVQALAVALAACSIGVAWICRRLVEALGG